MSVVVRVPTQLRSLTGGVGEIEVESGSLRDVLSGLDGAHPGFAERVLDESGSIRRFVNIFVADEDVRFLSGLETSVSDGQVVSIVPAVAGGTD
jgi:molybdopterin converting factor small subunit